MYHLMKPLDGLYPTHKFLDSCASVRILSFLSTFRDKFDSIGVSEATVVRLLAYSMGGNSKDVLYTHCSLVEVGFDVVSPEASDQVSWFHFVQVLLSGFVTEEVLRKAHNSVKIAEQTDRED